MNSKRAHPIANIESTFDSFASGAKSKSPRQKSQLFEPASAAPLSWSVHRLDLEAYAAGAHLNSTNYAKLDGWPQT